MMYGGRCESLLVRKGGKLFRNSFDFRLCLPPQILLRIFIFVHSDTSFFYQLTYCIDPPPPRRSVQISRKQMIAETRGKYEQLPEVVKKREEERKQREYASNRLRAQLYKKVSFNVHECQVTHTYIYWIWFSSREKRYVRRN